MWNAYINDAEQVFVIETRDGVFVSKRDMPNRRYPNPGKDELMSYEDNRVAWDRIVSLVEAANKGREGRREE